MEDKKCEKCKYKEKLIENYKNILNYKEVEERKEKEDAIFKSVSLTILIMTSIFLILKFCI